MGIRYKLDTNVTPLEKKRRALRYLKRGWQYLFLGKAAGGTAKKFTHTLSHPKHRTLTVFLREAENIIPYSKPKVFSTFDLILAVVVFCFVAVVAVVVAAAVDVLVCYVAVVDRETYRYSLVKIGSVTAEIMLTLSLRLVVVGGRMVVCRVIFMPNLTLS